MMEDWIFSEWGIPNEEAVHGQNQFMHWFPWHKEVSGSLTQTCIRPIVNKRDNRDMRHKLKASMNDDGYCPDAGGPSVAVPNSYDTVKMLADLLAAATRGESKLPCWWCSQCCAVGGTGVFMLFACRGVF